MNSRVIYLNSNDGTGLIGLGKGDSYILNSNEGLDNLQAFINEHRGDYIFLALSYDLKNSIEDLSSNNSNHLDFPNAILWVPEFVVEQKGSDFSFLKGKENSENKAIINQIIEQQNPTFKLGAELKPRIDKRQYLDHIKALQDEIQYGNIYEVNFCQEFFAENVELENSIDLYHKLNSITQTPFSCYFAFDDHIVLSGSPERFIKKQGQKLISQPIKGTIKRGESNVEDQNLIEKLKADPKEKAENVMIVDLVRNDLSKIAKKGTVKVEELFGIYTFKTVHQMISTISCEIDNSITFLDIVKALFPMGSMTGAPKISAMNLIEKHEDFARGIYSGSVGYIDPNGDFDLNVVIRSFVYNQQNKYLSCGVGGAITIQSIPELEYEECFTKVDSILKGINE